MKKIIASVATIAALTSFATAAHAGGTNVTTGGSSVPASFTSDHAGSVSGTCSLDVTDGALPTGAGVVSSLTSTTTGKISTICNTATSKLDVTIDNTAPAAGNAAAAPLTGYAETFQLTGGTGAYAGTSTGGFVASASPFKTDLSNGYSSTASTVDVTAKVAVDPTKVLPGGAYVVKVKATVTP